MKVWPFGVGLRGQASNHPELRWLKTVVVSVREKAHSKRQVGTGKTCQKRPAGVTALRPASPLHPNRSGNSGKTIWW